MSMQTETQTGPEARSGRQSEDRKKTLWQLAEDIYTEWMPEDDLLDEFRAAVMADLPTHLDDIIRGALHPIFLKLSKVKREPRKESGEEVLGKTMVKSLILDEAASMARKMTGQQLKEMGGCYDRLSGLVGPKDVFGDRYSFKETRELLAVQ